MLPEGSLSSRTWLARADDGHQAVLREVPDGTVPFTPLPAPGVVPLRDVTLVSGRRMTVWDLVAGESLQELLDRLSEQGQRVPLGLVARVVIDASRALASISPPQPHGGLGDGSLLLTPEGHVWVMDFGSPRAGRFTATGAPSSANDVFSMGGIVHAALTGYGGMYASAVAGGLQLPMPSQFHEECTPLVDDVVARAISRSTDKRQPDLDLFADELTVAVGPRLYSYDQVALYLASHRPKPGPPVAEPDPGALIDDLPTGEHGSPGNDITAAGQPPPRIPMGTQPGRPPKDAFAAISSVADSGPLPSVPQQTQPGVPRPVIDAPLRSSRPSAQVPLESDQPPTRASRPSGVRPPLASEPPPTRPSRPSSVQPPPAELAPRPSKPAGPMPSSGPPPRASNPRTSAPKPALLQETQPRLNVPPARAPEPEPANPNAISHAKLEWAETQTRVPTPPLGTPAPKTFDDDDDENLPTDFASKSDLMGIAPEEEDYRPEPTAIRPRPKLDEDTGSLPSIEPTSNTSSVPVLSSVSDVSAVSDRSMSSLQSIDDLDGAGSGRRKLIAALLIVIAGLFGLAVWKKQQDSTRVTTVTPIVEAVDDDGGEGVALEAEDAGVEQAVAALEDESDAGELEEEDGGVEDVEDAGASDAGAKKKVVKKKPPKRRRRR